MWKTALLGGLVTSIYAFVLMKEEYAQDINLIKILSCLLVVSGVYIISKSSKNKLA